MKERLLMNMSLKLQLQFQSEAAHHRVRLQMSKFVICKWCTGSCFTVVY